MLSSKQRAYLRGLANKENAIFQIGKSGISEEILTELDIVLE
ncbi:MAG: YhbY family RNA-binding protein, partial [Clostridia bacterium]|nr:YhbY family RNA-binding protein [Clostridia bacterium]